jgi:hypothetical protein
MVEVPTEGYWTENPLIYQGTRKEKEQRTQYLDNKRVSYKPGSEWRRNLVIFRV